MAPLCRAVSREDFPLRVRHRRHRQRKRTSGPKNVNTDQELFNEIAYLLIKEFQICSAFVLDILGFITLVLPVCFLFPLLILLFLILVGKIEVVFPLGIFTV